MNFGGNGDFPNFLFRDTLYFGILLTSLGASWFKKQANRPLLIKNKTRLAAIIPIYRRRTSRDDIERGKVRYNQVRIFARVFLQISSLPGRDTPLQPRPDGRPLWTPSSGAHEPLSPAPLECIIEWADNRIQPAPPSI